MANSETFALDVRFADLGLPASILQSLEAKGFQHPTKIQAALLPVALSGKDCLGQAKTGTGKTAAFALPMLARLPADKPFGGLVLVPTRELAIQVAKEFHEFARHSGHAVVAVYGGNSVNAQASKLEKGPAIIVGTPGRVMDMHERGLLPYNQVKMAVLDEVDRMLDIGFRDDIRRILGSMKEHPQTVFVSATISPEIEKLARSYMRDAEKIVTTEKSLTVSQVDQSYLGVEHWDKRRLLHHLLTHETPELTVVFCRTKRTVDDVAEYLQKKGIDAHPIHGDMYQRARDKVMERLRGGSLSVLVASDLAARGLDVDDISHVINYDGLDLRVPRSGRAAHQRGDAHQRRDPAQGIRRLHARPRAERGGGATRTRDQAQGRSRGFAQPLRDAGTGARGSRSNQVPGRRGSDGSSAQAAWWPRGHASTLIHARAPASAHPSRGGRGAACAAPGGGA